MDGSQKPKKENNSGNNPGNNPGSQRQQNANTGTGYRYPTTPPGNNLHWGLGAPNRGHGRGVWYSNHPPSGRPVSYNTHHPVWGPQGYQYGPYGHYGLLPSNGSSSSSAPAVNHSPLTPARSPEQDDQATSLPRPLDDRTNQDPLYRHQPGINGDNSNPDSQHYMVQSPAPMPDTTTTTTTDPIPIPQSASAGPAGEEAERTLGISPVWTDDGKFLGPDFFKRPGEDN